MKFSDLKKSILAQFEVAGGNRIVLLSRASQVVGNQLVHEKLSMN